MIYSSEQLRAEVDSFLERLPYDRKPATLYDPVRYALSAGGKRMRPVLMLMSYNLFNDNPEQALPVAAGLEIYHNYTLLYDDLMDRSDFRRGRPTVHMKWNDNTAILSGDSMLVLAFRQIACCPDDKLRRITDCFIETALEIGEGQQYDMDFESRTDVTEAEYIEMIRLKTGVLLACAMKTGAILADAPQEDQMVLYRLGERLGLAFQLQDDYLDVYGDEAVFGKPIGGDICNNKKTYMLIDACCKALGKDKEELLKWITASDFNAAEKIAAVTALYDKLGTGKSARLKIESCFHEAEELVSAIGVEGSRKTELRRYIGTLSYRET